MPADPIIQPSEPSPSGTAPDNRPIELRIPPAGNTSIDDKMQFEVDVLSHAALTDVCIQIYRRVHSTLACPQIQPQNIVLIDADSARAFDEEARFRVQATMLARGFQSAADAAAMGIEGVTATAQPTAGIAGLTAAMPAVNAILGLTSLFQADVSFSGRKSTISRRALVLELARNWESHPECRVHIPEFNLSKEASSHAGEILAQLDEITAQRAKAFSRIHALGELIRALPPDDSRQGNAMLALHTAREHFDSADAVLRQLGNQLSATNEKGMTGIELLGLAARFRSLLAQTDRKTFYLFAEILHSGGSFRVVRHFLRAIFAGDGLDVAGGCIACFGLFDSDGRVLRSGVVHAGRGFVPVKRIWSAGLFSI